MSIRSFLCLLAAGLALSGCAMSNMAAMAPGDLGVTPGGAQDIGVARAIIEEGGIPDQVHFRAEGLFSEHDLPLTAEPCPELLCPRAVATPNEPVDGSGSQMLVQLGFATSLNADSFERLPQNLALVVDISGSMAGGKIEAVREALLTLTEQLDERDHVALVAFDTSAELRMERREMHVSGRAALSSAIQGLEQRGGTDIEAGLQRGYGEVAPHAGQAGVGDRVMLFTDAQPNTGATDLDSFLGMVRYYGAAGIGISVFGVGLDLGAQLAQEVSEVRGGNYFYLADEEAIARIFDDEFDYIVTPLGYDLSVTVDAAEGLQFAEAFGAPLDQPGPKVEFGSSTLFLSARSGGMAVTMTSTVAALPTEAPVELATFSLTYLEADQDEPVSDTITVSWLGGGQIAGQPVQADGLGVYKMSVLLDEFLALDAAAQYCDGELTQAEAVARISEAATRLDAVATLLTDELLAAEVTLMGLLADNVTLEGPCWTDEPYYY